MIRRRSPAHSGDKWFAAEKSGSGRFCPLDRVDVSAALEIRERPEDSGNPPRGSRLRHITSADAFLGMRRGVALSLMKMNRIKEIHFADAVAVAEPGVLTGALKSAARAQGLFYPPDPASMKECSIGGNIATNAGGPRVV